MGMPIFARSCCKNKTHLENSNMLTPFGNPKPGNFRIEESKRVGRFVIVRIQYPDCVNYEGKKILVFENININKLYQLTNIDPHFCDSHDHPSPVARFKPDDKGWEYATIFCLNA